MGIKTIAIEGNYPWGLLHGRVGTSRLCESRVGDDDDGQMWNLSVVDPCLDIYHFTVAFAEHDL